MNTKEFLSIILLFILVFIGIGAMSLSYGADVDVVRDFDNTTVYHAVKSDSGSQAVYGLENNAKLIGRDKVNHTEPISKMANTEVKVDDGYYTYQNLIDENGIQLNPTDRVKFNYNRTLTAVYKFTPYMFAEIDVLDLHGHSASSATYPAMKHTGDSITKTFKDFTDVEDGYTGLYILDLDTNVKYQPGDKFTITYNDVLNTGLTRIIKTFQYVYAKDIVIENIIVENKTIENITYVNKTIEVPVYINKTIENITYVDKVIENITYVDKVIENITYVDKVIENITYVDKVIENITYVDKVVEVPVYVNKTVEVINYVNKTVEVINYVNKTIEVPIYVNKTIENITFVNKTVEVPVYVNKTIENISYVNKTIEVPFYKVIVIPEIIIDNPVIPIVNNNNTDQYNETNIIEVPNNNTTNTNNVTTKLNKENNTGTSTLDNIKTVTMKRTGTDNPIGLVIVIILFGILILIYNREDDEK